MSDPFRLPASSMGHFSNVLKRRKNQICCMKVFATTYILELKGWSTANAQPVETTTDNRHRQRPWNLNVLLDFLLYRRTDGRYQTYNLPCFTVDNNHLDQMAFVTTWVPMLTQSIYTTQLFLWQKAFLPFHSSYMISQWMGMPANISIVFACLQQCLVGV